MKSLSCGSTFGSLNTHNIKNADILIPDIVEQTEIGEYFSNLDHLITLHQWECIVCTKIKVNTSIQCKFIKIGVKLQKCILLSIILLLSQEI
ncbi:MAG: restriction endonuclease subunit S [Thomasclavelia sp.]